MTLIEVLISIFMVGVLIVLYSALFNLSVYSKNMKFENIAYHVASNKIEELRDISYNSLPASNSFTNAELAQLPSGSANFTISNYGTYSNMKEVVVTVNWFSGRFRSVVIKTLVGTGGINP